MTGVVLVAGKGRRLGADIPKCLHRVGGRSILERQLSALRGVGAETLVCVLGYRREVVQDEVTKLWRSGLRLVENPRYATTNTAYSLHLASGHLTDDFFYMNGDVVFRPDLLVRLHSAGGDGRLALVRKPCGDEEVKLALRGSRVTAIGKHLAVDECAGEFVGVAYFDRRMTALFRETLEEVIAARGQVNEYFEAALASIVDKVYLEAVDATDIPCIEIDFPGDLQQAQQKADRFD